MSFLFGRARTSPQQAAADRLHDRLVEQIRQPVFYTTFGVPDTFEGRFDLLVLHAALLLRRLRDGGPEAQALAQLVVDTMFRRFDVALRELGVSDVAVPKRMKRLAEAFKGRTTAYGEALAASNEIALDAAVTRNVLGDAADGTALAAYARSLAAHFGSQSVTALSSGSVSFLEPLPFAGRSQ